MNAVRRALISAVLTLALGSVAVAQERAPDATIRFSGGSIAAGVGYTWGSGELAFGGRQYAFTVNGLSAIDVGASTVEGAGEVYNLRRVEDFSGNYVSVGAGATVAGGGSLAILRNQNGVTIQVHATTQGLQLTLAPSGVAISLTR